MYHQETEKEYRKLAKEEQETRDSFETRASGFCLAVLSIVSLVIFIND